MISEIEPYNSYTGDGETTQFDFDFPIENNSQLVVTHTSADGSQNVLEYGVDYSIENEYGHYITFPLEDSAYSILSAQESILLELSVPISQETEYSASSSINLNSVEYSFDKLTKIAQILAAHL